MRSILSREIGSCEVTTHGNKPDRKQYIVAASGENRHLMFIYVVPINYD